MGVEIAVAGAGHVGLVSAAGLSAVGHRVRVYDVDVGRIEGLTRGETPFFEPGLTELLARVRDDKSISYHADAAEAIRPADVILLCVNTPNTTEGQVDLSALVKATQTVAGCAREGVLIVNRSTAPVGTAAYIRSIVEKAGKVAAAVAVNPEFLSEGTALRDFLSPDRIVIGASSEADIGMLLEAYRPIVMRKLPQDLPESIIEWAEQGPERVPVVVTYPSTAELIKYAANAFLAMKISFINEMAWIAEELGADVSQVAEGVGLDHRIGTHFLRAGIGWGGSCFPKDIVALQGMAETRGLAARMIKAANDVNMEQHRWVAKKLQRHLRTLVGRTVGLLGLTFKPGTDDMRNAPAVEIALDLARQHVHVRAFDPAIRALPPELASIIELADSPLALAESAEALVLITEWPMFGSLDLLQLRAVMREPLLLDGRNFLDPEKARAAGFVYVGVGR